jgi:hypothetical protein
MNINVQQQLNKGNLDQDPHLQDQLKPIKTQNQCSFSFYSNEKSNLNLSHPQISFGQQFTKEH